MRSGGGGVVVIVTMVSEGGHLPFDGEVDCTEQISGVYINVLCRGAQCLIYPRPRSAKYRSLPWRVMGHDPALNAVIPGLSFHP